MAAADLVWLGNDSGNEGDVNTAANWQSRTTGEANRVPVAGDTIIFNQDSLNNCDDGLGTLAAVALAGVVVDQAFIYQIGTSSAYLQLLCSGIVDIGRHNGTGNPQGSSLIKIDVGTTATTIIVNNSGTSTTSLPPIQLLATNSSTDLIVNKGKVGLAVNPGETSTVDQVTISYVSNQSNDASVIIGDGVTITTLDKIGGVAYLNTGVTTIYNTAGDLYENSLAAITTVNVSGGNAYLDGSGTITNLNVLGGYADAGRTRTARTVTNVTLSKNGKYRRDSDVITETNSITTDSGILTIGVS